MSGQVLKPVAASVAPRRCLSLKGGYRLIAAVAATPRAYDGLDTSGFENSPEYAQALATVLTLSGWPILGWLFPGLVPIRRVAPGASLRLAAHSNLT